MAKGAGRASQCVPCGTSIETHLHSFRDTRTVKQKKIQTKWRQYLVWNNQLVLQDWNFPISHTTLTNFNHYFGTCECKRETTRKTLCDFRPHFWNHQSEKWDARKNEKLSHRTGVSTWWHRTGVSTWWHRTSVSTWWHRTGVSTLGGKLWPQPACAFSMCGNTV